MRSNDLLIKFVTEYCRKLHMKFMFEDIAHLIECLLGINKKTWVQSPVLNKLDILIPTIERWEQESQKSKIILSYIVSFNPICVACDPIWMEGKEMQKGGDKRKPRRSKRKGRQVESSRQRRWWGRQRKRGKDRRREGEKIRIERKKRVRGRREKSEMGQKEEREKKEKEERRRSKQKPIILLLQSMNMLPVVWCYSIMKIFIIFINHKK